MGLRNLNQSFFKYFFGVPNLATCIFFLFKYCIDWTSIGYLNRPGMDLTPFPSSVGWDKIQTHNLLIVNLACYQLDQAFAPALISLDNVPKSKKLNCRRSFRVTTEENFDAFSFHKFPAGKSSLWPRGIASLIIWLDLENEKKNSWFWFCDKKNRSQLKKNRFN